MTEPRGTIHLITRAPITADYQHTIDFKTPTEQRAFWGSLVKTSLSQDKYSYIRRDRRYIQVGKPFEELEGVNYLMFQSREGSKWYYAFVLDVVYVNDNLTQVFFEIDVLQSFMFDYQIKPSYIAQSHVDRWDANHKPKYSRTEEGLEYGSEYVTEAAYKMLPNDKGCDVGFCLVYMQGLTTSNITGENMTAPAATSIRYNGVPYTIFIVPVVLGRDDDYINDTFVTFVYNNEQGQQQSAAVHSFPTFLNFMQRSAIGKFVHQIVYTRYLPFTYHVNTTGQGVQITFPKTGLVSLNIAEQNAEFNGVVHQIVGGENTGDLAAFAIKAIYTHNLRPIAADLDMFEGIDGEMPSEEMFAAIKAAPRTTERDRRFESKLLCYPYRYNVFTDWRGAPALIKNEYLTGDKITVKNVFGWGYNNPQRFYVENYRKDPEGRESSIMQPLPMEQPVISDAYYTYILQNKNQIAANVANATDSARLAAAQAAFNGAMGVAGGFTSGIGGAVMGNAAGAVNGFTGALSSGVNAGFSIANAQQNLNNMIRSENAKQQDIANLPDTISNANDSCFNITDGTDVVTFYRKKICCEFSEQLAQYWHMYGYKVKRVEVPNTRSRVRFNYVKTIGANVIGDIAQTYLTQIRAIYDNGVTFWHYSEKDFHPMDYTYENIEVMLL